MKNNASRNIIYVLEKALRDDFVRGKIDSISRRVEQKLSSISDDVLAWEPIPLELYTEELPGKIQSSWVFVIRADTNTGAERHSNSHQFMMSYRGQGDLQAKRGDKWHSNELVSDPELKLEQRWVSISPGTWHRVVTGNARWTVVSFHTVPADELIEERHDAGNTDIILQRYYLGKKNKHAK